MERAVSNAPSYILAEAIEWAEAFLIERRGWVGRESRKRALEKKPFVAFLSENTCPYSLLSLIIGEQTGLLHFFSKKSFFLL
jgi:hypothetical protein